MRDDHGILVLVNEICIGRGSNKLINSISVGRVPGTATLV